MRCHLCAEHATIATSVALLPTGTDRPYVMRLCPDHSTGFEHRSDVVLVDVPPVGFELAVA